MVKTGNNEYKRKKSPTNNTTLIEDDNRTPQWILPYKCIKGNFFIKAECFIADEEYYLVVPKNTIIRKFEVE